MWNIKTKDLVRTLLEQECIAAREGGGREAARKTAIIGMAFAGLLPASAGLPRQQPMLPPLQRYTVQAVALETTAPCFRVYAPPPPVPPEGIELDALVSFGGSVCPGPEADA